MSLRLIVAGLLAATTSPAIAMSVGRFVAIAEGLEARGVAALFSSDIKALRQEVEGAAQSLKAERLAAKQAGRVPAYCPPDKASLDSKELMAHFRGISLAQRERIEVRDALRELMARKYPC